MVDTINTLYDASVQPGRTLTKDLNFWPLQFEPLILKYLS
jgi:hypothetical protein